MNQVLLERKLMVSCENLLPGVYTVVVELFKLRGKLLVLMIVHFTIVNRPFPIVYSSYS